MNLSIKSLKIAALIMFSFLGACTHMNKPEFPHLDYLTEVTGEKALEFARTQNKLSDARLKSDPIYKKIYDEVFQIVSSQDKLPAIQVIGDDVYNFWQDARHTRGILRKASIKSFNSMKPQWETVLDIDLLAQTESQNWVYKGFNCLAPKYELCLISLSDGGKDAVVQREFNLKKKQFIKGGFYLPESKSGADWVDENTLIVGDATDPSTLNSSGYPTTVRLLKRNSELKNATALYTSSKNSVFVYSFVTEDSGIQYPFLIHGPSFFENEVFYIELDTLKLQQLPIPRTSQFLGVFKKQFLVYLREPFKKYKAGSVLSFSSEQKSNPNPQFQVIFEPTETEFYESISFTKNFVYLETLKDVKRRLKRIIFHVDHWHSEDLNFADPNGNQSVSAASHYTDHIYFSYTDFLTPSSYFYLQDSKRETPRKILQAPAYFNSEKYKVEQFKAKSKDGTSIPYFVVSSKNLKVDSQNPTLIYGYGGFEVSLTPQYLSSTGKVWLERGGVYVLANIRGGGEYGPQWHRSVLRENRHKAYQDFYAVTEDIINRGISSPSHIGIKGGSNGGLLTSVAFTQKPELFNAVISEVPLANMLEYHKWLAGASWMEEYGNPEDSKMHSYLKSYSPLHNLKKEARYPEVFYLTSTKDDRVHPAHARQMVARLLELGHPVLYNENIDGGHGRATNPQDWAELLALEYTYLFQKLKTQAAN